MDYPKIDDGLYRTEDGNYTIKEGVTSRPVNGVATRCPVFHVYDSDGNYVAQALDMNKDMDRAIREVRTKEAGNG